MIMISNQLVDLLNISAYATTHNSNKTPHIPVHQVYSRTNGKGGVGDVVPPWGKISLSKLRSFQPCKSISAVKNSTCPHLNSGMVSLLSNSCYNPLIF